MIISLIIQIIPIIVSSQTIVDDYFVIPQYIVTKAPHGLVINELNLLKKKDCNEYYKCTDSLIKILKGKYVFSIYFTYMNKRVYTTDYLSYVLKGKIYCLDKISRKFIPFKRIFRNYYGSNDRFKQSKTFFDEIEHFEQEYHKWDTIKTRTILNHLESLNFRRANIFPTDSFVKIFQEYIFLEPTEVDVLKYCYNKYGLYIDKKDNIQRDHLIKLVIEDALSPKKYIKFKFSEDLILEKMHILNLFFNKKN